MTIRTDSKRFFFFFKFPCSHLVKLEKVFIPLFLCFLPTMVHKEGKMRRAGSKPQSGKFGSHSR